MTRPTHFLDLAGFAPDELRRIIENSRAMKQGDREKPLAGKTLAMLFEKPSTRTRVSFQVGMRQLGGDVIVLSEDDMQLKRGETMGDTARALSRYVDVIMMRTKSHDTLLEMADAATVPVINGLSDHSHPCQIMADVMTFEEALGPIRDRTVAWSGDGNNVLTSWIHASGKFDFRLNVACPEELSPSREALDWAARTGARVAVSRDAQAAVSGADCVVTDVWVSMGDQDIGSRHNLLAPYRVDQALMDRASERAVFMHCLPAHRGEEVTADVMDGPRSVVWDEAENRLHVQKGILTYVLGDRRSEAAA